MNKNKKRNSKKSTEEREDRIVFECEVIETLPSTLFKLKPLNVDGVETIIDASLSGKLRQNKIRILPGDLVLCEVSPYDLTRGRITWRTKG